MGEQLTLDPNVPQTVALKYPTPKVYQSEYGNSPDRAMYSLVDGRVLYLPVPIAKAIEELQLGTREEFCICKYEKGKQPARITVWLTPEGERARAIAEAGPDSPPFLLTKKPNGKAAVSPAAAATGIPETDLERDIRLSIEQVQARKAGAGAAPPARVTAASPAPSAVSNGNGSRPNGQPAVKIPMDRAVIDAVRIVQRAMRETGEQWSDQAKQDLVSTILIGAQREGWVRIWEAVA